MMLRPALAEVKRAWRLTRIWAAFISNEGVPRKWRTVVDIGSCTGCFRSIAEALWQQRWDRVYVNQSCCMEGRMSRFLAWNHPKTAGKIARPSKALPRTRPKSERDWQFFCLAVQQPELSMWLTSQYWTVPKLKKRGKWLCVVSRTGFLIMRNTWFSENTDVGLVANFVYKTKCR